MRSSSHTWIITESTYTGRSPNPVIWMVTCSSSFQSRIRPQAAVSASGSSLRVLGLRPRDFLPPSFHRCSRALALARDAAASLVLRPEAGRSRAFGRNAGRQALVVTGLPSEVHACPDHPPASPDKAGRASVLSKLTKTRRTSSPTAQTLSQGSTPNSHLGSCPSSVPRSGTTGASRSH